MNKVLRKKISWLHTWTGLTAGILIVFLAVTGAGLILRPQLDRLVYGELLVVRACASPLRLDTLAARARSAHPASTLRSIEVTADPTASIAVQFKDKDYVYVDPCSGRVLGTQNEYGGFFGTLDWLHRFRFMEPAAGKALAGWATVAFTIVLIVGGIVLWWPSPHGSMRQAARFNPRLPGSARTINLHKVVGLYTSVTVLLIALTAVPIAFTPVKEMIYRATGYIPPTRPKSAAAAGLTHLPMEDFWRNTRQLVPSFEWVSLRYPAAPQDAVEVEIRERGMPHENAKTYLYMDAYTGRALRLAHYSTDTGLGRKIYLYCIALHAALVGGLPFQLLLLIAALAIPVQAYSGFSPYLRRKLRPSIRDTLMLEVRQKNKVAEDICCFELVDPRGRRLPPFSAGAHIDVHLGKGIIRQYSLCNSPHDTHRYVIAVSRHADSRGGSVAMHDRISVGDVVEIGVPRNHFPLVSHQVRSVLIAGGIGVTPIFSMAEQLASSSADFVVHYCVRSREHGAFLDRLSDGRFAGRVSFYIAALGQRLHVDALFADCDRKTHFYVCGPTRLIEAVLQAARRHNWPDTQVHREYFAAESRSREHDMAFEVVTRRGQRIPVPKDQSIVSALAAHGIEIPTSCAEGVCGTCLTRVIDGEVVHNDRFLTAEERARNDRMTPCCSRACGQTLVLDLE